MTLPNFLIVGAMKGGTTSLHEYLAQHPQVFMTDLKEPRFFALENDPLDYRGPDDPAAHCEHKSLEAYESLFADVDGEAAIGESSTLYLSHPDAPAGIHRHVPDARIVAVLRHPVERAYSHFVYLRRDGREPCESFREALSLEAERADALHWGPLWHYQRRGFYGEFLRRFDEFFPRDRIHIVLFEDLTRDRTGVVRRLFEFLGVDADFEPDLSAEHNVSGLPRSRGLHRLLAGSHPLRTAVARHVPEAWRRRVLFGLQRLNYAGGPELDPELRAELCALYRDDVLWLQDRIGRDLSEWLE